MSYCRFSKDSDVYLYPGALSIVCCGCRINSRPDWYVRDSVDGWYPDWHLFARSEAIVHLNKHRSAGHMVPQYAIDRLLEEIKDVGDEYDTPGIEFIGLGSVGKEAQDGTQCLDGD